MVASSKILPRARPFQDPRGLGDSHVHNNVGIEIPGGARGNDGAVGTSNDTRLPPTNAARTGASRLEVPDHDAGRRWRACSEAFRATP